RDVLGPDDDLDSFWMSRWGAVVAFVAIDALAAEVEQLGASTDFNARIDEVRLSMARILGKTPEIARQAVDSNRVWRRFVGSVGFRGTTGSVKVFDVRERDRRGSDELAAYDVDLPTFFARAQLAPGTESRPRPVIVGYQKKRSLHLDVPNATAQ